MRSDSTVFFARLDWQLKGCVCTNMYKQTTLVQWRSPNVLKIKVTRLLMDKYLPKDHLNKATRWTPKKRPGAIINAH